MRHLQSFKYVKLISEIGSIRGAAESCAISPSALNRHIQSLELDIGIQIFDRLSVGVRLSTEGELFYQFALLQLRSFERLQSQINDLKGLQTGIVRLGISAELNGIFINNQIAEFQNEYPQIAFQIKIIDQNISDIKSLIISIEGLFNETDIKIEKKWNDFKEIMNKDNISRKECLLLPFKTISKALKF